MSSHAVARRGSQTPRLEHFPTFFTTAGDDAVDLAAVAGLEMFPWQEHVLRHSLGERRDGRWAAFRTCLIVPRQNGKNAVLEARELAGLFLFGEKLIVHTAHEYKTARESMMSMMTRIRQSPELLEYVAGFDEADMDEDDSRRITGMKTGNSPGITLKNGNRLSYAARSKGSGRGFTGDLVVLDEAYALQLDEMAALLPTMAARSISGNPQVWFTSSAGMRDSTLLASLRKQGREKKVERLAYFEWAADPSAASDDVQAWYEANPSLGALISEEFVQDEYDTLARETGSDEEFRRERLGIWDDDLDGTGAIDADAWRGHKVDALQEPVGPVILAADTTIDRKMSALVAVGADDVGVPQVRLVKSAPASMWLPDMVVRVCREHPEVVAIVIDDKKSTEPIAEAVADALDDAGLPVEVVRTSYPDMAEACSITFDLIHEGTLRHGADPELDAAVRAAVKDEREGAFTWSRKKAGAVVVPLVAMSLAVWEWGRRQNGYDPLGNIY